MKTKIFVFALCTFLLMLNISCSKPHSEPKALASVSKIDNMEPKPENFDLFYKRFYKDSIFQVSRVLFPLPTYDTNQDLVPDEIALKLNISKDTSYVTKAEWRLIEYIPAIDTTFEASIEKSDTMVVESAYIPSSDVGRDLVFKLQKDLKWYLVFYSF